MILRQKLLQPTTMEKCVISNCTNIMGSLNNNEVSFHHFPHDPEIKEKWRKVVCKDRGDDNYTPSRGSIICSHHFLETDIYETKFSGRQLSKNAVPIIEDIDSPMVSSSPPEDVCRICLATDVKMFDLRSEASLIYCMDWINGFQVPNKNIKELPQCVCYVCRAQLLKFYELVIKSIIAQSTLLDIFANHGQISKDLVKQRDRKQLNLESTLGYWLPESDVVLTLQSINEPTENENDWQSKLNIGSPKSFFVVTCMQNGDSNNDHCIEHSENEDNDNENVSNNDFQLAFPNIKQAQNKTTPKPKRNVKKTDNVNNVDKVSNIKNKGINPTEKSDETKMDIACETTKENNVIQTTGTTDPLKKCREVYTILTSIEKLKCFKIADMTLQEQIKQWKIEIEKDVRPSALFQCEVCSKKYIRKKALEKHVAYHAPVRGNFVCPVCKERFQNEIRLLAHTLRVHSKKYQCKNCPKVYYDLDTAKRHEIQHSGKVYECEQCPYTTRHLSLIWLHRQQEHANGHHCALCGRCYLNPKGLSIHINLAHPGEVIEPNELIRCEECDIAFCSEDAKRIHILTYKQHKTIVPSKDPTLNTTCSVCGQTFDTVADKLDHKRMVHHLKSKYNQTKHSKYPRTCEHCEVELKCRRDHYWHVRKLHPLEGWHPETPVFVCDKCGKGFQVRAKLRYHEATHDASPKLACPSCPRRFFHVEALRSHLSVHSAAKPYACQYCGRAFRCKSNMLRHTRIHSGETPYECKLCGKKFKYWNSWQDHIKHSHFKMPWPPRVRRNRNIKHETVHEVDSF